MHLGLPGWSVDFRWSGGLSGGWRDNEDRTMSPGGENALAGESADRLLDCLERGDVAWTDHHASEHFWMGRGLNRSRARQVSHRARQELTRLAREREAEAVREGGTADARDDETGAGAPASAWDDGLPEEGRFSEAELIEKARRAPRAAQRPRPRLTSTCPLLVQVRRGEIRDPLTGALILPTNFTRSKAAEAAERAAAKRAEAERTAAQEPAGVGTYGTSAAAGPSTAVQDEEQAQEAVDPQDGERVIDPKAYFLACVRVGVPPSAVMSDWRGAGEKNMSKRLLERAAFAAFDVGARAATFPRPALTDVEAMLARLPPAGVSEAAWELAIQAACTSLESEMIVVEGTCGRKMRKVRGRPAAPPPTHPRRTQHSAPSEPTPRLASSPSPAPSQHARLPRSAPQAQRLALYGTAERPRPCGWQALFGCCPRGPECRLRDHTALLPSAWVAEARDRAGSRGPGNLGTTVPTWAFRQEGHAWNCVPPLELVRPRPHT